jgi:hypothetical protein
MVSHFLLIVTGLVESKAEIKHKAQVKERNQSVICSIAIVG